MLLLATFLKFVGGSNPIPEKILADQEESEQLSEVLDTSVLRLFPALGSAAL